MAGVIVTRRYKHLQALIVPRTPLPPSLSLPQRYEKFKFTKVSILISIISKTYFFHYVIVIVLLPIPPLFLPLFNNENVAGPNSLNEK